MHLFVIKENLEISTATSLILRSKIVSTAALDYNESSHSLNVMQTRKLNEFCAYLND